MSHTVDYFATLQRRIESMTPEQLANMTRVMARVVNVDSLRDESLTQAAIQAPHQRRQAQQTTPTKK